jgi:asparagine synthase (glutamine-hydrolysing)
MLPYIRQLLLEGGTLENYFERPYIERLINAHASGKGHYLRHIYLLLSFALWHREFIPQER